MIKRKIVFLSLVILAGFLPSVGLYVDLKIYFLPILYFIGFLIFSIVINFSKKNIIQNSSTIKETKLYALAYAGSAAFFYIIGLIIFRK